VCGSYTESRGREGTGVLKWKLEGEKVLEESGIPFTIVRPSRLTDGPYTSYDLNTLLKSTSGTRQDVKLSPRDDQIGEASRIAVAGANLLPFSPEQSAVSHFISDFPLKVGVTGI
jgi:hypothetical protein